MKYISAIMFIGINVSAFAINVTPDCNNVSASANSSLYSSNTGNGLVYYTNGLSKQFFSLTKGDCLQGEEPGVYKSTLILKQDGNLVNYIYDTQGDITYMAFASDTSNYGVTSASFYLDSSTAFNSAMIELLDKNLSVIKSIAPLQTKYINKQLSGSLVLSNIEPEPNFSIQELSTYDGINGELYQYQYNIHPVYYVDMYFDKHTLETRDSQYAINILDSQSGITGIYSCRFPFIGGDCDGKVKYVESNHYLVYLEDTEQVQIAKTLNSDQSQRAIYFDGLANIFFSWNDSEIYTISLYGNSPQTNLITYFWLPSQKYYSTLHLLSWDDNPSLPDGDYQATCNMDSMTFVSGILSGSCSYINATGKHWANSSLNYDQQCKSDPTENDTVTNKDGVLTCQQIGLKPIN